MDYETLMAVLAAYICVVGVIAIAALVCQIIGCWKIYTKAGEEGWKALIPFYSFYTRVKLCAPTLLFWIWLGCIVANLIFGNFNNGFCKFLTFVIGLALCAINILISNKLSKAFGHGVGFTVGLVLLNPIFLLILGLDSSTYQPENIDLESFV